MVRSKTDYKLDMRGMMTSYGLLKVIQVFKDLAVGQVMEIKTENESIGNDILNVLKHFSFTVVKADKVKGFFCLRLKKEASAQDFNNIKSIKEKRDERSRSEQH